MKKLLVFFLLLHFLTACQSQASEKQEGGFTITGKVKTPLQGKVQLSELKAEGFHPLDSVALNKDNTYTIKGSSQEPGFYMVNFFNSQKVLVIVKNGDKITLDVDGNNPNGAFLMKGSKEVEQLQKVLQLQNETKAKASALQMEFQKAAMKKDEKAKESIQAKFFKVQKEQSEQVKNLIKLSGPTLASFYATNLLNPEEEYAFLSPLVADFEKAMPNSPYVKNFAAQMAQYKNLVQVGQQAPEITLNNPEGQPVSLSSLRGKYVLIDFWASWCGPCRQENPNVVRMYNRFKGKNFEIFGVSLDREKNNWIQAISSDGLSWVHVSDLKFWESAGAVSYGVRSIPATFLLDPKGVVIAKNLRGKELEDKLAQVLGQ